MKNALLFSLLLVSVLSVKAQETLFLLNGDSVLIQLHEVDKTQISYTLYNYENQVQLHTPVNEVAMIVYKNGYCQVFNASAAAAIQAKRHVAAPTEKPIAKPTSLRLGGPRIGLTAITGGIAADYLRQEGKALLMTQFGWQLETRLFQSSTGLQGMMEMIPMVGGMEQGRFVPSLSVLCALRGREGFEFGLGPQFYVGVKEGGALFSDNYHLAPSTALVLAMGRNFEVGEVNFPINFVLVPATDGVKVSLVVGFNSRGSGDFLGGLLW